MGWPLWARLWLVRAAHKKALKMRLSVCVPAAHVSDDRAPCLLNVKFGQLLYAYSRAPVLEPETQFPA
jgi:hypothetical protein